MSQGLTRDRPREKQIHFEADEDGLVAHAFGGRAVITPPQDIDGAAVLKVADLSDAVSTGRTKHVVKGDRSRAFAALAIVKYESEPGFYLFYCDAEWRAVTDTHHETIERAVAQAVFEFANVHFTEPGR